MRRLAFLCALGLAGCAVVQPDPPPALTEVTGEPRAPADAWASLPPAAGPVLSVIETTAPGARRQRIVLDGAESLPGENAISVSIGTAEPVTGDRIDREMDAALPGTPMRFAAATDANAAGGFGYALGEAGPFTCIYAWQVPDRSVEVRVRLCRRIPPADLLELVRGLTLRLPADAAG